MIYHRKYNHRTQTDEHADQQLTSQELWGKPPYGSEIAKAQAYEGSLPDGMSGIEFRTNIEPDTNTPPGMAYWTAGRDGVRFEDGFAKISVTIMRCRRIDGIDIYPYLD